MMQSEIGFPPAEAVRPGQAAPNPAQKKIVDSLLAQHRTTGLSSGEATALVQEIDDLGTVPVREAGKSDDAGAVTKEVPKIGRQTPGWPDSPRVLTLASIVREVLASTDDIPPEEDFTTMLLQKLEEAGLDTSAPIVDYYA